MRIRTIKPEFWESENLGNVSREARLLFIGLFSSCDDHGRTRANSRILASRLFPYDDDAIKLLPKWLKELEQKGSVRVYVVGGETYLDIPKWLSHQKIDKPSASKLPEFVSDSPVPREDSRKIALEQGSGNGNRDQGMEGDSATPPAPAPKAEKSDDDWLVELSADPAYRHISISGEWAKMKRWCEVNRKQPNRRRFVNWINKCDRPMFNGMDGQQPLKHGNAF